MKANPGQLCEFELRTAVAILILGDTQIRRSAIRWLLPKGEWRIGKKNTVSRSFLNALRALENLGHLVRHDKSVMVKDRDALQKAVYDNLTSTENAHYVHSTLERQRQLYGACPQHVHELEVRAMQYIKAASAP